MCVRFTLSLRNVEDLLFERGIDLSHETIRFWWNRFGPMFAGDIRRQRASASRAYLATDIDGFFTDDPAIKRAALTG